MSFHPLYPEECVKVCGLFCRFSKKLNKIDVKDTNVIDVEQKCKNRKILCFKMLNFFCNCDNLKVNFLNDISRKIRGGEQKPNSR